MTERARPIQIVQPEPQRGGGGGGGTNLLITIIISAVVAYGVFYLLGASKADIAKAVSDLSTAKASIASQVEPVNTKLTSLQTSITSLQADISTVKGEIATLKSSTAPDLSPIKSDIQTLKGEVEKLKESISTNSGSSSGGSSGGGSSSSTVTTVTNPSSLQTLGNQQLCFTMKISNGTTQWVYVRPTIVIALHTGQSPLTSALSSSTIVVSASSGAGNYVDSDFQVIGTTSGATLIPVTLNGGGTGELQVAANTTTDLLVCVQVTHADARIWDITTSCSWRSL